MLTLCLTHPPSVQTGQLISVLRETRLLNNTVVIFTADHGELAMEHRQFYKMSMFEGSSHIPLLIMGSGLMSGLQLNQLVSLVDIYPTILGKKVDGKCSLKGGLKFRLSCCIAHQYQF